MLKWISTLCVIIFTLIVFVLPLSDKNSEANKLLSNLERKAVDSLNQNKKDLKEEKNIVHEINTLKKERNVLTENTIKKWSKEKSTFNEYQLMQQEQNIEKELKENFAKLNAILKKENIQKNNKVKISEEEKQSYREKLDKLEVELSQLTISNN